MITRPADWLIATAAFPLLGAIGVAIAQSRIIRRRGMIIAQLGMAGGAVCGVILAIMLAGRDGTAGSVQVTLWKWFSFSLPQAPSITFGLEANSIKASLVGVCGILVFIAIWKADSGRPPLSDDLILTNSLLYAAGAFFVFTPNLAQSLMGWGAISLLTAILIRLSHQLSETNGKSGDSRLVCARSLRQNGPTEDRGQHILLVIIEMVRLLESAFRQAGQRLARTFPNWLSDQAEVVNDSPVSLQLLAALLASSAILLTWLLVPTG